MNYRDQLEGEKSDARNAVEEYVYNVRDRLDYALSEFVMENNKGTFKALLSKTEDWLYEEGEDQPKKVYVERLAGLQKFGDPIEKRLKEFVDRPTVFNELGSGIVHYEKIVLQYASGVSVCGVHFGNIAFL